MDQEESYIFSQGLGSMEVYADKKHKTFVHSMKTIDAATIPLLNYHPVFRQDEPLHFIWCLAGKQYFGSAVNTKSSWTRRSTI